MNKIWKERKGKKILRLNLEHRLTHFGVVGFTILVPIFMVLSVIQDYFGIYGGVRPVGEMFYMSLPFIIITLLLYYKKRKALEFKTIEIEYTNEQFNEAIQRMIKDYYWNIEANNTQYFRGYKPFDWTGSWGEMITIIKRKNKLHVNSICNPNKRASLTSYRGNKKNIKNLITHLINVKNETPYINRFDLKVEEYSLKNILKRIGIYSISVALILTGILILYLNMNILASIIALVIIIIPIVYIYSDIVLMIKSK